MSFRNTFITDYIYQASDETRELNAPVRKIFEDWAAVLDGKVDERGYGYYGGFFRTSSGTLYEAQEDLRQIIPELEKVTNISFRLVVLLESEAMLCYQIEPRPKTNPLIG